VLGALLTKLGVNVVYTRLGVAVAMVFVSFPFVVRTMQPVLQVRAGGQPYSSWSTTQSVAARRQSPISRGVAAMWVGGHQWNLLQLIEQPCLASKIHGRICGQ